MGVTVVHRLFKAATRRYSGTSKCVVMKHLHCEAIFDVNAHIWIFLDDSPH